MIGNRSFWSKLKAQPTVGVVLQSASPLVANSMSAAGFDWLVIDPINSPLSQLESFAMQTAVGDGNPTPVFMRVGGPTDRSGIQQATDTGAAGILVPNVRSADDIAKARRPTRFPPVGDRSLYGPLRAHHKEGVVVHMLQSDRNFVVAIQLEKAPHRVVGPSACSTTSMSPFSTYRSYAWSSDFTMRCSPRRPPATARYLPGSSRGFRSTSGRAQSWQDSSRALGNSAPSTARWPASC